MRTGIKRIFVLFLASAGVGGLGWIFLNMGNAHTMSKPDRARQQAVVEQSEIPLGSSLKPSEIGEFATFDPDNGSDDGTYPYRADPDGKYFHFEGFVSDGNSQWDTFSVYEEEFTASSTLPASRAIRYDAENLRNDTHREEGGGIRATTWCEGTPGYGIGERIRMSITTKAEIEGRDDEIRFRSLLIVNGYAKDAATWKNNTRVKVLRLYVGDRHWCDLHLEDVIKPQIFNFPDGLQIYPVKSGRKIQTGGFRTDLSFEIMEVYPGDKFNDTCITGIALDVAGGIY